MKAVITTKNVTQENAVQVETHNAHTAQLKSILNTDSARIGHKHGNNKGNIQKMLIHELFKKNTSKYFLTKHVIVTC